MLVSTSSNENFWQLISITHWMVQCISIVFVLSLCAKPRKQKNSQLSATSKKQANQQSAVPKTVTKSVAPNTTASATPVISVQSLVPLNKKQIQTPKTKPQKKSTKSKRDKSKHEKSVESKEKSRKASKKESKKESSLKKFFKFSSRHESKEKKDAKSVDEGTAKSGDENNTEKLPFSSKKVRRRKHHGDGYKTAEDDGRTGKTMEDADDDKIVDPIKVIQLGNIDVIAQEERQRRVREIEQMPSGNYCEEPTQLSQSLKKEKLHVKIAENNCKLFETHPDPKTKSFKESLRRRKKIRHHVRSRSRASDSK